MMASVKETANVYGDVKSVYGNQQVTTKMVNCNNKRRQHCLRLKAAQDKGLRDITIINIYIYFYINTLLPRPPYKHPPVLSTQLNFAGGSYHNDVLKGSSYAKKE